MSMHRPLAPLIAACALSVLCALPGPGRAQSAPEPDAEPAVAQAAPEPLAEARVQALRQQIAAAPDAAARLHAYDELARAYYRAGRVAESLKVRDELTDDTRIPAGRRSLAASDLAVAQALMGDHARARRLVARAQQLARETTVAELETLPREPAYASLHAEAEIARRAQGLHDVALAKLRQRADLAWANFNDPALSARRHQAAANELLNNVYLLTIVLVQNNRRQEALNYVDEIAWRLGTRSDLQATPAQAAAIDVARSIALCSHDDYDGALAAVDNALAAYRRAGVQEHDLRYGSALRQRLMVALALGRLPAQLADVEALERGRARNPVLAGSFPAQEAESLALAARGQWAAAAERVGDVMARNARAQGTEGPFYLYESAMQMLYRLSDPAGTVAFSEVERFVNERASLGDDWIDARYRGAYVEDGALAAALAWLMRQTDPALVPRAQALALRVAELMRINASQGALADGAARLAAGDPKLRALVEQEQLLRYDQATGRQAFAIAASRLDRLSRQADPDAAVLQRQAAQAAEREKALQAANGKLRALRREIAAQFPAYRELISPRIPDAQQIGAALRPGEVYVNLQAAPDAAYAFVIQPGGQLQARRLEVPRTQLRQQIHLLRLGFDAGVPPTQPGDAAGFDLAAAHGLYQALIAPIAPQLGGAATVYLSTSGLLGSVPWNVLLTAPARTLAEARWWIATATPVLMPSGSALVQARSRQAGPASQPMAAFADPSFDGQERPPAADANNLRRARPRAAQPQEATFDYRRIPPLPETWDEVRAIGTALGAAPARLLRGTQATRSRVLREDLSDVRVVAFATHGLLPGDVPGLSKSALALAYEGRGLADSVLTIDDVVGLRLNADWVVLSACNTGLDTGSAGDALSALSRGFFAAGARTLLATHWAVESESARQLTTGLFQALAADPALGKAGALARVQRGMLAGQYGPLYRHPYFWGAFFLAGDGGR